MRRVFFRYFLSIMAISCVVLLFMFGMLLFQYGVSQERWKKRVYDDFVVSVENAINNGHMAGYGLNSIMAAVSNIDDDRISGFILRDVEGSSVLMFTRSSDEGDMTSVMPRFNSDSSASEEPSSVKNATRIDVATSYNRVTNTLMLSSVNEVQKRDVSIEMPANLAKEGIIGSVVISVDGTDAFIIDLLTFTPRTYKYSKDIINSCNKALIISLPIGLIFAALAAWVISLRNTRYINEIRRALNDLSHGKSDVCITHQRNSELNEISVAIEDLDKNLKSNAKSRQAWLRSISHDLNTPTTAMKMIIDGLNDGVFPASSETFKELQKENDTLSERIGRVIDYSTLQADTTAIIADVDAENLVNDAVSSMKVSGDVKVDIQCSNVRCDEKLMGRAILELLNNAMYASEESHSKGNLGDGYPVRLTLKEIVKDRDDFFEVQIVNDGKLPQDMDIDFFEPWARGDWARTSGGSGLGLPISATIFSLHRGTLAMSQLDPNSVQVTGRWPRA